MAQNQINVNDIAAASLNALTMAQQAVEQARAMLESAGVSTNQKQPTNQETEATNQPANGSNSNGSNAPTGGRTSSAGRTPSAEQSAIREQITEWCHNSPDLFTIKSMTEFLGKDRIQVRNAINALEGMGIIGRYAEKLPEGRGAREIIYKPSIFDVGL